MKIQEIMSHISLLRKNGKQMFSNYYLNYQGSVTEFKTWQGRETIVFCVQEEKLLRCFFASTDIEELLELLWKVPNHAVMDYVSREKKDGFCWVDNHCFEWYTTLIRFTNADLYSEKPKTKREQFLEQFVDENCGEFATMEDAKELYEMLYHVFDYRISRLPSMEELQEMIQKNWVLVYREEGKLIAFLIYQIKGKKYYGYQIYNEGTADITFNLERKAMKYAIENYGVKSSYAWVEVENQEAKARVGADFDGTYDYIFVRKTNY